MQFVVHLNFEVENHYRPFTALLENASCISKIRNEDEKLVKIDELFHLLETFRVENSTAKILRVPRVDNSGLYQPVPDYVKVIVKTINLLINNAMESATFNETEASKCGEVRSD